jgi:hypothetical protein
MGDPSGVASTSQRRKSRRVACVLRQRADKRKTESRCVVKYILRGVPLGMSRIHPECPESGSSGLSVVVNVLLLEEPDEEEEEDEEEDEGDGKEDDGDDETDDGYSE